VSVNGPNKFENENLLLEELIKKTDRRGKEGCSGALHWPVAFCYIMQWWCHALASSAPTIRLGVRDPLRSAGLRAAFPQNSAARYFCDKA
jgi:hypothetical protein